MGQEHPRKFGLALASRVKYLRETSADRLLRGSAVLLGQELKQGLREPGHGTRMSLVLGPSQLAREKSKTEPKLPVKLELNLKQSLRA